MKTRLQHNEWRKEFAAIRAYQDPELHPPCVGTYHGPGQAVDGGDDEGLPTSKDGRLHHLTAGMQKQLAWLRIESDRRKIVQREADALRRSDGKRTDNWWWDKTWDPHPDMSPYPYRQCQPDSLPLSKAMNPPTCATPPR